MEEIKPTLNDWSLLYQAAMKFKEVAPTNFSNHLVRN